MVMTRRWVHVLWASFLAIVFVGWAAPASAQNGTMSGRVLDAERRITDRDGKPVAGLGKESTTDRLLGLASATVTLELKSEPPRQFKVVTDVYGEWYKSGLPPGTYDIAVKYEYIDRTNRNKTNSQTPIVFVASATGVVLKPGEKLRVPDLSALTEEAVAAGRRAPTASNLSSAEAEAANKRSAELEVLFKEANAASAAGNHPEAITKLTALAEKLAEAKTPCAACYAKIGESQLALKEVEKAEASFLKAIELDPKLPAPYMQLATIYNSQSKFDEAAKMNDKATELVAAAGGGAAGGDTTAAYNSGIIHWNAGQYEDAKADFAKAVQLDPKNANAQYYLGMAIFNLASSGKGTMADAKAPFQEYLKLAPTGEFAEVAKAILATIK
jgi:Flp pilus assembly protein TadD